MLSRIPQLRTLIQKSTYSPRHILPSPSTIHTQTTGTTSASTTSPFRIQPQIYTRPASTNTTPMAAQSDTSPSETLTPSSLQQTLETKLSASHVQVEDMSGGCGQAFNALIVSEQFNGKTALQRHRLVNNALKAEIAAIHAWTPRCLTPEQWEKEQAR